MNDGRRMQGTAPCPEMIRIPSGHNFRAAQAQPFATAPAAPVVLAEGVTVSAARAKRAVRRDRSGLSEENSPFCQPPPYAPGLKADHDQYNQRLNDFRQDRTYPHGAL